MVTAGWDAWMQALLAFVAVALVTLAAALLLEFADARRRRGLVARQLERLSTEGFESVAPGAGSVLRGGDADSPWVQRLAARFPHLSDVRLILEQADLHWSVQTYITLAAGTCLALGSSVLLLGGGWLFGLPAGCFGAVLPYFYVARTRQTRLRRFEELFPGAVDLMGRAIRAGHPFTSGLKMVADESAEPVAGEFRRTFEEQRFGIPIEDTLISLADRIPLADVRIFVTALLIQREVGGNLAEILDNLSGIIRERFTLARQVRVLTAEGRISMYVLGILPIGVGIFVFYSTPNYVMTLFTNPIGHYLLGGAALLQVAGWIWMRRITEVDF